MTIDQEFTQTLTVTLTRIADSLQQINRQLGGQEHAAEPDFAHCHAFTWRKTSHSGYLQPVQDLRLIAISDLVGIDQQKTALINNTMQFLQGKPANNALLWGSRGTGKSSLIKALLHAYADQRLRVIEMDREHLVDIPAVAELIRGSAYRFIVFCDDLSFEASDVSYKALKVALDGGMNAVPANMLIYATSNRRHLLPEYMADNVARYEGEEIHHKDAVEEKISLSERFGIWLSFYPFAQQGYLDIVEHWLDQYGLPYDEAVRREALQWSQLRASRSGRCAQQFVIDYAGRSGTR